MKKITGSRRSTASLLVSGVATITISQSLKRRRLPTTAQASHIDRQSVADDARHAYTRVVRELEHA
jgi:hypothetical protein